MDFGLYFSPYWYLASTGGVKDVLSVHIAIRLCRHPPTLGTEQITAVMTYLNSVIT